MRIISKRIGFKAQEGFDPGPFDPVSPIIPGNKKQRLIGRIHNAGEYAMHPAYSGGKLIPPAIPDGPMDPGEY